MHGLVYVGKAKHAWAGVWMEGQACMGWCMYGKLACMGWCMSGRPSMHGMVYVWKAKHAWAGVCMEGQAYMGWCMYGRPSMHGLLFVWKAKHAWAGVCMEDTQLRMHGLVYVWKIRNYACMGRCMNGSQACMDWSMYGRPSMHGAGVCMEGSIGYPELSQHDIIHH